MKINYLDENKKRKNNSIESGFKYDSVLKAPKSESIPKAGSLGYAPKIVSTPKTPRFTLSDLGKNSGFNTVPALNEGARIKNNIKNVIAQKEGELNVRHIFDDIDDKTVERNIPIAQNAINNSIRKGTLKKTQLKKLPNLLDGLTMFYASAEKGKPKAEKLSRNAAYTEVVEKLKDIGIPKMQNPNLFANTKGSFNDAISEIQKKYGIDTQTQKTSETIKSEDKAQDMYSSVLQNLPVDANIEVKPVNAVLTKDMLANGALEVQKLSNKATFNYDDINEILSRAEKLPGSLKKEERELLETVLKNTALPLQLRNKIQDVLAQPEVKITEADPELAAKAKPVEDTKGSVWEEIQKALDDTSNALAVASLIPGVDTVADIAAIPVDILRGDWLSAGLGVIGAFPIVGEFADAAKLYRTGDNLIDAAKVADNAIDAAKVADNVYDYSKYPKTIHSGRQGKHIVGHNNYEKGKSVLTIAEEKAENLLKRFTGKGKQKSANKEWVDFGEVIGQYVDPKTGKAYDTTKGIIHYSKDGAHIVPANPLD